MKKKKKKKYPKQNRKKDRVNRTGTRPVKIADEPCQLLKNCLWDQFLCSSLIIVLVYVSFFSLLFFYFYCFHFALMLKTATAAIQKLLFLLSYTSSCTQRQLSLCIHITRAHTLTRVNIYMHKHMQTI